MTGPMHQRVGIRVRVFLGRRNELKAKKKQQLKKKKKDVRIFLTVVGGGASAVSSSLVPGGDAAIYGCIWEGGARVERRSGGVEDFTKMDWRWGESENLLLVKMEVVKWNDARVF